MIVDKQNIMVNVTLEKDDWPNGLGRMIVDTLKTIPFRERRYDKETKRWSFVNTQSNRQKLSDTYQAWKARVGLNWKDIDDFDIEGWLKQFDEVEA